MSVHWQAIALIDSVKTLTGASCSKYAKCEVGIASFQLRPENFINPYNPSDVDMYAIFTAPSGKQYRRDAFWYEPYQRCDTCANNVVQACGWKDTTEYMNPSDQRAFMKPLTTNYPWRVRFAPPETGSWSYKVYVHSIFGTDSSASNSFTVTNDTLKGYIGTDTLTPSRYFKYKAIGQVLMPLGFNSISVGGVNEYTMYNRVIIQVVYQPFKIFRAQFRGVID